MKSNICLIGMPGAGKTYLGEKLANKLKTNWIDTDSEIHSRFGRGIAYKEGENKFLEYEERVLLSLNCQNTVISTGGSCIYSDPGMQNLVDISSIIYLKVPKNLLLKRINNYDSRGIIGASAKSFDELLAERTQLYKKYADFTVEIGENESNLQFKQLLTLAKIIMRRK